jgi:hypothetical protein
MLGQIEDGREMHLPTASYLSFKWMQSKGLSRVHCTKTSEKLY